MWAFIAIGKVLLQKSDMKIQLQEIKDRLEEHDAQLNKLYDALENLLDEKAPQKKWEERQRIGFKK